MLTGSTFPHDLRSQTHDYEHVCEGPDHVFLDRWRNLVVKVYLVTTEHMRKTLEELNDRVVALPDTFRCLMKIICIRACSIL